MRYIVLDDGVIGLGKGVGEGELGSGRDGSSHLSDRTGPTGEGRPDGSQYGNTCGGVVPLLWYVPEYGGFYREGTGGQKGAGTAD